jgi:hypothetical protein
MKYNANLIHALKLAAFLALPWLGMGSDERNWKWLPGADHPCNIVRMPFDELFDTFGPQGIPPLHSEPIVLVHHDGQPERNAAFAQLTLADRILDFFEPDFEVTLSSSNSFSEHRRTIPFSQYLNESFLAQETTPDQSSNETWYLFGETYSDEWNDLVRFKIFMQLLLDFSRLVCCDTNAVIILFAFLYLNLLYFN